MIVINKTKGEIGSLPVKELKHDQLKPITSILSHDILKLLAIEDAYPKDLAKKLKVHEQKVYYHIRNLEKHRIIEIAKTESIQGAVANYYRLTQPAFLIKFKNFISSPSVTGIEEQPRSNLEPFIENGQLNSTIIVGSPDPHGPEKARSRDGYYGIDLALFLGTFLDYMPKLNVRLDTETRAEDLKNNLILIGGPVVNTITEKINSKMTIRFDKKDNWCISSTISNKKYHADENGIIVRIKNPFNPKKQILIVAGKRYAGTRAVMMTFLKYFNEIFQGNKHNNKILAKVVEGIDRDSDGIVDDVEILE